MAFRLIGVRDEGPVRLVTLERPQVHNAMSEQLMDELSEALKESESAGQRVLVVTGSGEKTFCSGGDLKEFKALRTREATMAMSLRAQRLARALRRSPIVSIAALNGDAYGGGLEFALAFDLRVAARHARFGFLQVTLGITPAWRGVSRLRELVGRSSAILLLLTGERFDAQTAENYGIVDRIAEGSAVEAAQTLAQTIASYPATAVRIIKMMVDARTEDDEASLDLEASRFSEAWLSDDHWNALAAVRKRAAGRRP